MATKGVIPGSSMARGRPADHEPRRPGRTRKPKEPTTLAIVPAVDGLECPTGLESTGRAVWVDLADSIPGRNDQLDAPTLLRFCQLVEERDKFRQQLDEHGALLEEPIVSPRGDIVGTRLVPNPAEQQLRRADKALDTLSDRLLLSPAARARTGLTVSAAAANAERLIAGLLNPRDDR